MGFRMEIKRWGVAVVAAASLWMALGEPALAAGNALTPEEKQNGWQLLFDGRSLTGWKAGGSMDGWGVEDGAIACLVKGGGYLYTEEEWSDFVLACDFKTAARVNSGIFLRWSDLKDPVNTGMEIQILDSFGRTTPDKHDCGALYDILPPAMDAVKPAGEWNHIVITCQGPIVRVVLNGQQVINVDLRPWTRAGENPDGTKNKFSRPYSTMLQKGHLGLQDHGGRVWYRNLKVKPLGPWSPPVHG